jgi:hypothetical protein
LLSTWSFVQEKTQGLQFYSAQHPDELRPLVQSLWEFVLPTLATTFSDAGADQLLWQQCLQARRCLLHLLEMPSCQQFCYSTHQ